MVEIIKSNFNCNACKFTYVAYMFTGVKGVYCPKCRHKSSV